MEHKSKGVNALEFVGRVLISGIFISAGISKIREREQTKKYIESKRLPMPDLMRKGAVAVELGVAPAVALGILPRYTAPTLAAFLLPTSVLFHDFWNAEGQDKQLQAINFFKNLAIMGGLLILAAHDLELARAKRMEREEWSGERPDYLDESQDRESLEGRRWAA
jgi:putative oxidoreductase